VASIVYWARALGRSRGQPGAVSDDEIAALRACRDQLRAAGDAYWAAQADVLLGSAQAWALHRNGDEAGAVAALRDAAKEEDGLEKLPVTPGPIVPAREQLGELMLTLHRPGEALAQFKLALVQSPNRRGALMGALAACEQAGDAGGVRQYRRALEANGGERSRRS
jgi:hypothetical protein